VGGLQGLLHDNGEVIPDRRLVDGVFQPDGEGFYDAVCVLPGPVEPPVHGPLHPPPDRVEQRRHSQGRPGHRHRLVDRHHPGGVSTIPAYTATSRPVTIA
jgi:hypothetical protein